MRCFFASDSARGEFYPLSLHDALPISSLVSRKASGRPVVADVMWMRSTSSNGTARTSPHGGFAAWFRSEEHTSELQSHHDLVCRLQLEKKKTVGDHVSDDLQ